jgi:ABC-type transport system substrate-binding protein/class 3 adenylate cyclase
VEQWQAGCHDPRMPADGERRIVSVLVTDVVGSTTIAEQLGPERSKFLFDEVVGLLAEQVRRFDGTVAQLTGDGLLALFGAPAAHGDDAERAVRAALAMHEELSRYAADVAEAYGIELAARVAVNTGPVVVPSLDVPPDVLYNALGDTVNVAARLQPSAGPGGTAVGPATERELRGRFELEPLGELELKGKSEPVVAFRVVREAEPQVIHVSPLVGRDAELTAVGDALARLEDGLGTIVVITGEPGIGKSRLVAEARQSAAGEVDFLVGNASSYSSQAPFWPVRDLLRGWLGLGVADPEGRVRLELKAALARRLDGRAEEVYPFVASLLGLSLEGPDAERLSGLSRDSVQRQTFEAVAMLLEALAQERALCVVFEDLHWADESTLALIEELLELADREAVVILLLYRSERDHAAWHLGEVARQRFPHRLVELELRSLAPEESTLLAGGAAGAALPLPVSELLAARSGGNPFFLEEALRDLVERGVLRPVNAHWELTVATDELTVPLLVQETLQARLDRLQPGTREVASIAAVIGTRFGLPLLERLADPTSLPAALSELQRLDLVVEERRRPVREYRFRHGLVQEVAYASLTEGRRRELHRAAGEALEQLRADALEQVYEPLARHYAEAGETGKAVEYLLAAGDAAWALYADQPALAHYRRALEFMPDDDPRARDLLCKIALAHHLDFDFAAADAAWNEAAARPVATANPNAPTERLVTAVTFWNRFLPGITYDTQGWWLTADLFSGLLRLERGLNLVLDAAAELGVSEDGLRYRATLRTDAAWSDGTPVTAWDFEYAWNETRRLALPTVHLLDDIEDADALDERTLVIRLREPRPYFPYLLATPATFPWPAHVCEAVGDRWRDPPYLVTNGAFVLVEQDEKHALLRVNPSSHWRRGNVGAIDVLFLRPEETESHFARHELDLTAGGPRRPAPIDDTVVETFPSLSTWYVGFVCTAPPFHEPLVRRAFAHALDRVRFVDSSQFVGQPASDGGFLPPAMPGHDHRIGLEYNPDRARELLASAGYEDGRGLPEIVLAAPFPEFQGDLAAQWRETLGASVRMMQLDPPGSDPRLADPPASCWFGGWSADVPDPAGFFAPLLRGLADLPAAHFRDADLLDLLATAERTWDRDERLGLFQQLDRLWLSEQVAIVPLCYSELVTVRRPWVSGFWTSPLFPGHLTDIEIRR